MDQRKLIDKILEAVEVRIQGEVGTLLGSDFSVVSGSKELVSKEEVFARLQGKQVCAHLDISGDIAGKGCVLIGIKDAIRLGGTLIMLPDMELQEVIGREEYQEEIEDSYGEIANIIAGSISKSFEEKYPKVCRFIRKEQAILVPAKVVIDSDEPVANQSYYLMSSSMLLDGRPMGDLVVLFPALTFDLEQKEAVPDPSVQPSELLQSNKPKLSGEKVTEQGTSASKQRVDAVKGQKKTEKSNIEIEKQKKKVDRLLTDCQRRLTADISALLGIEIVLETQGNQLLSKEDFFTELVVGKQILTDMEVVGESQDTCYFSMSKKDAIYLGGVLIMLPPTELASVVNEEDLSEDGLDAYGEVTNIVSGAYTAVFEEQYSQKLRFIKKELKEVVPRKVVAESDEPIPGKMYYCHSMQILAAGKQLGLMHMLFPAQLLQLIDETPEEIEEVIDVQAVSPHAPTPYQEMPRGDVQAVSPVKKTTKVPSKARELAEKQKKLVDKLLSSCRSKVADEVKALLGAEVQLNNLSNKVVSKEEFFHEEVTGKQAIASMDVVGESEGKSYLVLNLPDAIRVGGMLIMLPPQELESVVSDEVFSEDTKDAYGEIANIIAGVYTGVFEEQYTKKIRFIKTNLQQIEPMKVTMDSAEPFSNSHYYLSSAELVVGDSALGRVNIVFPLALLELEGLLAVDDEIVVDEEVGRSVPRQIGSLEASNAFLDILLIGDDESESAKIAEVLGKMDFAVKTLSFKDNVHNYIPGQLKAIYLVMQDVNEQAFGAAIKISASCSLPLIAAGPGWTRTKVIKAVKYGIRDILLTPASKTDIEENIASNLLKLAA